MCHFKSLWLLGLPLSRDQTEGTIQEAGDKLKLWKSLMQTNSNCQVVRPSSPAPQGREKLSDCTQPHCGASTACKHQHMTSWEHYTESARQLLGGKLRPKEVKCLAIVGRLRMSTSCLSRDMQSIHCCIPQSWQQNRNYSL